MFRKTITKLIAEIGINHNGSLHKAKQLALRAKKSGANYVKFQMYDVDKLILKDTALADYQRKNNLKSNNQYELLKKLQLSKAQFSNLNTFCRNNEINFMVSVFDIDSLNFLKKLKCKYLKIPSGELSNFELLDGINNSFSKIILSTGMSDYNEIKNTYLFLTKKKKINSSKITILHCISDYPTRIKSINLNSINYLKKNFKCDIGLSDHTMGIKVSILASMLGITLIERHFTNNINLPGPDHKSSLTPSEFKKLSKEIIMNKEILGTFSKKITIEAHNNKYFVQKQK